MQSIQNRHDASFRYMATTAMSSNYTSQLIRQQQALLPDKYSAPDWVSE